MADSLINMCNENSLLKHGGNRVHSEIANHSSSFNWRKNRKKSKRRNTKNYTVIQWLFCCFNHQSKYCTGDLYKMYNVFFRKMKVFLKQKWYISLLNRKQQSSVLVLFVIQMLHFQEALCCFSHFLIYHFNLKVSIYNDYWNKLFQNSFVNLYNLNQCCFV